MNDTTELTDRPIFKPSEETEKLINRLKAVQVGEVITWLQMEECTGLRDRLKLRGCLTTARKHLLDSQVVFSAVRAVGLKRLEAGEVVQQESTTAIKVRRTVKASMRRLSTVQPEALTPAGAAQYRMTSAALGVLSICTKASSLSKLQQAAIGNGNLDGKGALELFR